MKCKILGIQMSICVGLPLLLLAVSACDTEVEQSPTPHVSQHELSNSVWVLESYGSTDDSRQVLEGTRVTLEFDLNDNVISGSTGCNTYFGNIELSGRTVRLDSLSWTERACAYPEGVMQQEANFMNALQGSSAYEITDGLLVLQSSGGIIYLRRE